MKFCSVKAAYITSRYFINFPAGVLSSSLVTVGKAI